MQAFLENLSLQAGKEIVPCKGALKIHHYAQLLRINKKKLKKMKKKRRN